MIQKPRRGVLRIDTEENVRCLVLVVTMEKE